ncbi:unnamed protein product [Ilex paraguariensis]|uniref:G domain-containing protein n=1 Tax=Ilex paraguariensis TaxID=185542 RepID=A0ABC8RJQ6_9AQUA
MKDQLPIADEDEHNSSEAAWCWWRSAAKFEELAKFKLEMPNLSKITPRIKVLREMERLALIAPEGLDELRHKLLAYRSGDFWMPTGGIRKEEMDIPPVVTLLLVGFHNSGKSSLVNLMYSVLGRSGLIPFAQTSSGKPMFASFPTTPAKNLKFTESIYDRGESAKTMQYRLACTTTRFNQLLLEQFRPRRLASTFVSPFRSTGTAHPTNTHQAHWNSTGATTTPVEDISCAVSECISRYGPRTHDPIRTRRKQQPLDDLTPTDKDGHIWTHVYGIGEAGGGVIRWRPEQLDTAEEALRRAVEIWRQNVMRGDPDSPHGRVLRLLRGEKW